jgi:hypothetical protein
VTVAVIISASVKSVTVIVQFYRVLPEPLSTNCLELKWRFDVAGNVASDCYRDELINFLYKVIAVYSKNSMYMYTDELHGQNAKFRDDTAIGTCRIECCNRNRIIQISLWSQTGKGKRFFGLKKTGGKRNLYMIN